MKTTNKVYNFPKWGLKITAKNDIVAEIAKYVHLNNEGRERKLNVMIVEMPDDIAKYIVHKEHFDHFIFEGFEYSNYDMAIALQLLLLRHLKWCDNTSKPDNCDMTSLFSFNYAITANGVFGTTLSMNLDNDFPIIPFLENYDVDITDRDKFDNMKKKYHMDEDYLRANADYL